MTGRTLRSVGGGADRFLPRFRVEIQAKCGGTDETVSHLHPGQDEIFYVIAGKGNLAANLENNIRALKPVSSGKTGRDGRIRTGGPLLPKQMRYQAAPRPDGKDKEWKYKRNAVNRQRGPGIAGCGRPAPDRYASSTPAAFISAINARSAWPRWLIRFFSSAESSAIVFPREGTWKSGS